MTNRAELTPEAVERAIDAAGRDEVFALARQLGWTADLSPPLWVWAQLAEITRSARFDKLEPSPK